MTLLAQFNACCRRLWRDESGVVLAFTVIVFLSLFVIACSVYAVGENIRQRIELQNAADAAAYSAAVVQADALSRVAAINKAMSWTYVQMCRRQMDYIVGKWLNKVVSVYSDDRQNIQAYYNNTLDNFISHCDVAGMRSKKWWIGDDAHHDEVRINLNHWERFSDIQKWSSEVNLGDLTTAIDKDRNSIAAMNDEEDNILRLVLPKQMEDAILAVVSKDTADTYNDEYVADGADIRYSVIKSPNPESDYCELYNNEDKFLKAINAGSADMHAGHNTWFPGPSPGELWSRKRNYIQWGKSSGGNWLVADWMSYYEGYNRFFTLVSDNCGRFYTKWEVEPLYGRLLSQKHYWAQDDHNNGITAKSVWDDYFKTCELRPYRLSSSFFDKVGTVVVSVGRRLNNPLLFMASDKANLGLYGFFHPGASDKKPYAWAAAAARAGYKNPDAPDGNMDGAYWTPETAPDWKDTSANLSQVDWDAELIPLTWVTSVSDLWNSLTWRQLTNPTGSTSSLANIAGGDNPNGKFLH